MLTKTLQPKIILVLGMHRSGTSLVAQLIAKWGAYMGDDLMRADKYNPEGYWEYNPLFLFHEKLLEKTNNKWYAPSEELNTNDLVNEFGDEARQLVGQMDKVGEVWCWKDPRLSLFLGFWKKILAGRDIIFVLPFRNPNDIASSLFDRDRLPPFITIALWEFSTCKIIEAVSSKTDYMLIDYNKIVFAPEITVKELFNFLNKCCQITENQDAYNTMIRAVKKSLHHAKPSTILKLSPFQIKLQEIVGQKQIPEDFKIHENQVSYIQEIFTLFRKIPVENLGCQSAQLFFKNESTEYIENQSLIQEINWSTKKISFNFDINMVVEQLRFDPFNNYVKIRINSIQLLNQGKVLCLDLKVSSNALYSENGEYLFDTTNPQVFIDFQSEKSVELDEVIIELEYLQKGGEVFPQLLQQKNIEIGLARDKNYISTKSLQTSEYQKQRLEKELAQNNILIQNQEEKIGFQNELLSSLKISNYEILKQFNNQVMQITRSNSELSNIKKSFPYKLSRILEIPLLLFRPLKLIGLIKGLINLNRNIKLLKQSDYFDTDYYLKNNPDVKLAGVSAIKHYLFYGGLEGRNPSAKFDSQFYLQQNSDVAKSEINPLVHFLKYGKFEGREVFPDAIEPKPLNNSYSNPLIEYFCNNQKNIIHKWSHYFEIYHDHFNRFVNTECVILEIGVGEGGSLQMWKKYFGSSAKIYGVDINPKCKDYEEENIEIFIGSQSDRNFLQNLKQILPKIDILIDDGGHTMDQQITCFEELFDHIKENGIYLCEDTRTSYWDEYGGGLRKQESFIEFSKTLIDHLNIWHIRNNSLQPIKHSYNLGSLHYYDSIFIIEKSKRSMPHHERRGENIHEELSEKEQFELDFFLLKLKILGVPIPDNYDLILCKNNPALIQYICGEKYEGLVWPTEGETMIGYKRLTNLEFCIIDTINNQVEGDLIETGVWRGGACIFMRALLKELGVTDKKVWLADSFSGLPAPNVIVYPQDKDLNLHLFNELAISLEEVKNNFAKYDLLDEQVKFLKGWFKDTMPIAPIEKLSVLRLDGDLYESTIDVLLYLYPKLAIGGYCIIDDWGAIDACRNAVEDYRKVFECNELIQTIDWTGVYWKKEQEVTPKPKEYFIKMLQTK